MKLKAYNKKVIVFVWENMMTSVFVADRPHKLGPVTRKKKKHLVIIFSHKKSITYNYNSFKTVKYYTIFTCLCIYCNLLECNLILCKMWFSEKKRGETYPPIYTEKYESRYSKHTIF
jgi:hypothetical protein